MTKTITELVKEQGKPSTTNPENELYIVSGATGALGKAYLNTLPNAVGLYRSGHIAGGHQLDLLDSQACEDLVSKLDLNSYERVTYIHPVGAFAFEPHGPEIDENEDGIDDRVFRSNVETFTNMVGPLRETLREDQELVAIAFGSVADKYDISCFASYSKAKNELRDLLKETPNIRSLFVNVSTVNTGNENKLRPRPEDKEHWLSVDEVVEKSNHYMRIPRQYTEIDVYKPSPHYFEGFYEDHNVRERWRKQTRGKNE